MGANKKICWSMLLVFFNYAYEIINLHNECRQIFYDCSPNDFQIDIRIVMNDLITDAAHVSPRDFWGLESNRLRNPLGCFTDDFEGANNAYTVFSSSRNVSCCKP
jgi:hypothetical protein